VWPPLWFGAVTSGRSDTSERVDELLADGARPLTAIVCDTGPLVAAAIIDDAHHRECVDALASLHLAGRPILVPGSVVAEVGYLLAREGGARVEAQFSLKLASTDLRSRFPLPTPPGTRAGCRNGVCRSCAGVSRTGHRRAPPRITVSLGRCQRRGLAIARPSTARWRAVAQASGLDRHRVKPARAARRSMQP
jgi:hypothetical protein